MNHVFVGECASGSSWIIVVLRGSAVSFSELTFTVCVGAGQIAQSAVKARVTIYSGDMTTRKTKVAIQLGDVS